MEKPLLCLNPAGWALATLPVPSAYFPVLAMDRYPTLSYLALVAATFAATYVVSTI